MEKYLRRAVCFLSRRQNHKRLFNFYHLLFHRNVNFPPLLEIQARSGTVYEVKCLCSRGREGGTPTNISIFDCWYEFLV
jgi:hypothetical protein